MDCSSNFRRTPSNLPFLAEIDIFKEKYETKVLGMAVISNISKIQTIL